MDQKYQLTPIVHMIAHLYNGIYGGASLIIDDKKYFLIMWRFEIGGANDPQYLTRFL